MTKYLIWTAILAAALFFPASNLVYVLSVRRLQTRTKRQLNAEELKGQRRRARFIAFVLVVVFAALFNYNVFGIQR